MVGREDAAGHWIIRKETVFKPCLCEKIAACNWTVAAHATLLRDFVAHSREKIAGVTSVLVHILAVYKPHSVSVLLGLKLINRQVHKFILQAACNTHRCDISAFMRLDTRY